MAEKGRGAKAPGKPKRTGRRRPMTIGDQAKGWQLVNVKQEISHARWG